MATFQTTDATAVDATTIDDTWGGVNANAYGTLAEIDSLLSDEVFDTTAWDALTTAKKKKAILEATRQIDAHQYIGEIQYDDQLLKFPRDIADDSFVQYRLLRANAWQANCVAKNAGKNIHAERQANGILQFSEKIGEATEGVTYGGTRATGALSRVLCPEAALELRDYFEQRRIERG